jgi:methylmalonyl-CoA/ethylmalonyl-CoA epimerase
MQGRSIHHIAIVVQDLDAALCVYADGLGLELSDRREVPEEGVEIAFLPTGNGLFELLSPLGTDSGVGRFLAKHGEGMHHVCVAVDDIEAAMEQMRAGGAHLLTDEPRTNADGVRYVFVHPRSTHGVLLELYEIT